MSFRMFGFGLVLLLVMASLGHGLITVASADGTSTTSSSVTGLMSEVDLGTGSDSLTITWKYLDQNGRNNLTIIGAKVMLLSSGKVLAEAVTDVNGSVSYINIGDGTYSAIIYAEDQSFVKVANGSLSETSVYNWTIGSIVVSGDNNLTKVFSAADRAAWNAYDVIRTAAIWLYDQVNWTRDKVTVCWPYEDWPHSHGDDIHVSASTNDYSFIWDDYTLAHEYGHCVQYAARGDDFPDIVGPDPHYLDSESSASFAFVEGWAEFFGCAVFNDPSISTLLSLESTVFADGPLHNGDYGDWDGGTVEGAVANVLWDIYDGASTTDHPSWDYSGYGDGIDNEFSTFWNIFLNDDPETMEEVWSLWQEKNDSLAYVFKHARFNYESTLPFNPTNFESSAEVGQVVDDQVITIRLIGASDTGSGIAGYSVVWDQSPYTVPDQYIDVYGAVIQISQMSSGIWYLHVRAIDGAGNAANGSYDIGPFTISASSGSVTAITVGDIVLIAAIAIVLAALVFVVSRVVRKPTQEDVRPYVPPYQPYNPYAFYAPYQGGMAPAPPPMTSVTSSGQSPSQQSSTETPQIRFCMGCGRPDAGGTFCPYCRTKVR